MISELKAAQGKVDIEVEVKSISEPRTFNKYGKDLRVASAQVIDASGEIVLSLWNEDIDKVKVGDKIKITNGYVSEFNGQKQLTSGKFGKLEVVGAEGKAEHVDTTTEKKASKAKPAAADEVAF